MEQTANNAISTLSAAITSTTATSLTVTSATLFPATGTFRVLVDSEIMKVTAVSSNTFTVTRGDGNSTAATHLNGAAIVAIWTKEAMDNVVSIQVAGVDTSDRRVLNIVSGATVADNPTSKRADITIATAPGTSIGAGVSRPSPGTAGRVYIPTDGVITSVDNGTAWVGHNPFGLPFTIPPASGVSPWTLTTDGTNGVVVDIPGGGINFGSVSGNAWCKVLQTIPSGTNYTADIAVSLNNVVSSTTTNEFGVVISDGTKMISLGKDSTANGINKSTYAASAFASPSSSGASTGLFVMSTLWLRIKNNGTNRLYYVSTDGIVWKQLFTETFSTFLTETLVGFYYKNIISSGSGSGFGTFFSFDLH